MRTPSGKTRTGRVGTGRTSRRTARRRASKPASQDPRLLAIGGLFAGVCVIGLFVLLSGSKAPPPSETAGATPSPSASAADERPLARPSASPSASPRARAGAAGPFKTEEAAYDALAGAWGEDAQANPQVLAAVLSARGRLRLLEWAFEGAKRADAAEHGAVCARVGLDPAASPTEAGAAEAWLERYEPLAALARPPLAFRGRSQVDPETCVRVLAGKGLWLEVPVRYQEGEAGWQVDLPQSLWGPLGALQALPRAQELLQRGEFAEAYALIEAAPRSHGPARQLRFAALEALVQGALERAARASQEDPLGAAEALAEFEERHEAALGELGLSDAVGRALVALRGPEGRVEPPSRAEAFAARAKEGLGLVAGLRERIAREKTERASLLSAEQERARAESRAKPLNVPLTKSYVLKKSHVVERDARGVKIKAPAGELFLPWSRLPRGVALDLRRYGVRKDNAEDQLRFGFWALRQRRFDFARRAFARVVELDERLKPKVPDVDALEAAGTVFNGELSRSRGSLRIEYDFKEESQARDWLPTSEETQVEVSRGELQVASKGEGLFLVGTQEIAFDGRCELEATISEVSQGAMGCFGVGFDTDREDAVWYLVAVDPAERTLSLVRFTRGKIKVLAEKKRAVRKRGDIPVEFSVSRQSLEVDAGGRSKLSVKIESPSWSGTRVFAGGVGPSGATLRLEKARLRGKVRRTWLRKSFAKLDALLFKALSRSDELPVFSAYGREVKARPLSAEDEFGLSGVPESALEDYRAAKEGFDAAETWDELLPVVMRLSKVVAEAPGLAAAYYLRARLLRIMGRAAEATHELEVAERLCPRFYEAMALRARLLADQGKVSEAIKLAEQVIEIAPGQPEGYGARGLVRFELDDLEGALSDFEIARALDPTDEGYVALARNVQNVFEGPPWTETFSAETKHYSVRTNVSQSAAREYGALLEAAREHYLKKFPVPAGFEARKSKVLIFDTDEGYHAYADLSTNDRVESSVGCYLPRYRQLLLYEEKLARDKRETVETLFHEGFHQYLDALVPDNAIPFWLNEGLAEFMSAVEMKEGKVVRGGLILAGRLRDMKLYVEMTGGRIMPFPQLMQESPQEFYEGEVWAKYAQAWAMVHFFELGANESTKRRYQRYVEALRQGTSAKEAYESCWADAPWDAIQRDWWRWVQQMK